MTSLRLPNAGRVAVAWLLAIGSTGCLAMSLASRGAPTDALRVAEFALERVDLPVAHEHGHEMGHYPPPTWVRLPEDGWLHGFDVRMVDRNGDPVPSDALHHFKVIDPDKRELFSPVPLHLAGGGSETQATSLPRHAGVPIQAGDSLLVTAMLHNPTDQPLDGVELTVVLTYSPVGDWKPPLEVVPFFTHVTAPMTEPTYDLPPGASQRSLEITPLVSGWLIGLGGHLHQYGLALRLEDGATGEVLWEKRPVTDPEGVILEVPYDVFTTSRGPRLTVGHTYRVTALYDNPTGETIADAGMGTLGGAFVPDITWPDVDKSDEAYRWYLAREVSWGMDPPGR